MPQYKAKWAYRGRYSENETVDVHRGQVIDLAEDVAAWVNRDRPGTLEEHKPPKRAAKKAQDRQQRGGSNRGAK